MTRQTPPGSPRYYVQFMRGYGSTPWWVRDRTNEGNGITGSYASEQSARRFCELMNAGTRREVAMHAVSTGADVLNVGDLVYLERFRTGLIPAKIVELERVPRPDGPTPAHTHQVVTVKLTATRGAWKRGETFTYTGSLADCVIPRTTVRTHGGHIMIRSGVFNI